MEISVQISGGSEALKALRVLEPTVAKQVGREVTAVGRDIADAMRAISDRVPASRWVGTSGVRGSRGGRGWPAWAPINYRVMRRELTVRVLGTSSNDAIPAMFETMGRGTRVRTAQGHALIRAVNESAGEVKRSGSSGKSGRARRVASERVPEARRKIEEAVARAVTEVNRRMP